VFVVEMEEDGTATLRFGDGVLGHLPEDPMFATYRIERGRSGNVGAESIAHVVTVEPTIRRVRNPLAAAGGVDPEDVEQVRRFAPVAFRRQERAVTEADYAVMAERHDDVLKAVARRRWTGSWYTVFVTVERRGGRVVDADFKADLARFLEQFRLAGEDLEVEAPIFVPLDLLLVVCVAPGYFSDQVEQALLRAFSNRQFLDGTRGFFHPDNFTFGQPVYLSQVVGAAMQVAGVDWVNPEDPRFIFQRFGELPDGEIARGLIPMEQLEIARCDNSLSLPENGRFRLVLMGGR
jgi:predicted phage baseplate assembly protein